MQSKRFVTGLTLAICSIVLIALLFQAVPSLKPHWWPIHGNVQSVSGRALSLRVLSDTLQNCSDANQCSDDVRFLGGITRVTGYVADPRDKDVILYGVADKSLPPLHTEDFVAVLRNTWGLYSKVSHGVDYYTAPGCSIDPNPALLTRLNTIEVGLNHCSDHALYARTVENWRSIAQGPQSVRVLGLPFDCRMAKVLVDSDYYMKRIVDGSAHLNVPGLMSLTDLRATKSPDGTGSSFDRFWFTAGKVSWMADTNVALLQQCPVVLETESEMLASSTKITGSGHADSLAAAFARQFTATYAQIGKQRPIYMELNGLFRLVAVSKMMKQTNAPVQSGMSFQYLLAGYPLAHTNVPSQLAGIASARLMTVTEKKLVRSTVIESRRQLTCGGVAMNMNLGSARADSDTSYYLSRDRLSIVQSRPSSDALSWPFVSSSIGLSDDTDSRQFLGLGAGSALN